MMLVFLFLGASALVAPARRLPAGPRRCAKHATVMNGGAAALLGTVAPTLGIFQRPVADFREIFDRRNDEKS